MKFSCALKSTLLIIRDRLACRLPQKDWATLLHFIYHYRYFLVTNYLAIKLLVTDILVLAEITLLKTTCHFLLLLIGFDTLTYQKDLQLIPYTCGSSRLFSGAVAGE